MESSRAKNYTDKRSGGATAIAYECEYDGCDWLEGSYKTGISREWVGVGEAESCGEVRGVDGVDG
jgi:hypothetical protein